MGPLTLKALIVLSNGSGPRPSVSAKSPIEERIRRETFKLRIRGPGLFVGQEAAGPVLLPRTRLSFQWITEGVNKVMLIASSHHEYDQMCLTSAQKFFPQTLIIDPRIAR
jgi:hypothetical protein